MDIQNILDNSDNSLYLDDRIFLEWLRNRELYIDSEIDGYMVQSIVPMIREWNREDIGKKNRTPITVFINSIGGNVAAGFSIIDSILLSKTPVKTVNIGRAYSMGYLIFLAGHIRTAYPNATYLMHDGQTAVWDSGGKAKDTINFYNRLEERIKKYILSRTTMSEEEYDKRIREEVYMFNDEALAINAVHSIESRHTSF